MENNTPNKSNTLPICKETLAKILRFAIVDKRLTELSVRVLTYICIYCDDTSVTNDDICDKIGISHRETIAKIWKNLIDTNWIVRNPKINPRTGKIIKGYLYRISVANLTVSNHQQVKPRKNPAQCSNEHDAKSCNPTRHQNDAKTTHNDVLSDSTHNNKGILINIPNTSINSTPLTPHNDTADLNIFVKTVAKRISPNIGNNDINNINRWVTRISTNAKKTITKIEIEAIVERLATYHNEGFDITKLIVDSIEFGGYYLLSPDQKTQKALVKAKKNQNQRAHRFENDEYIQPENEMEKKTLADKIDTWYKNNINPKNKKQMSTQEIEIVKKHKKHCFEINGYFSCNWKEYIKQNEINSFTSLLDQVPGIELTSNTLKQSKGFQELSAIAKKLKQQRNGVGVKTL